MSIIAVRLNMFFEAAVELFRSPLTNEYNLSYDSSASYTSTFLVVTWESLFIAVVMCLPEDDKTVATFDLSSKRSNKRDECHFTRFFSLDL